MALLLESMHKKLWPDKTPVRTRAQRKFYGNPKSILDSTEDHEDTLKKNLSTIKANEQRQLPVAIRQDGRARKPSLAQPSSPDNEASQSQEHEAAKGGRKMQRTKSRQTGSSTKKHHIFVENAEAPDEEEDEVAASSDEDEDESADAEGQCENNDIDDSEHGEELQEMTEADEVDDFDESESLMESVGDEDFNLGDQYHARGSEYSDYETIAATRKRRGNASYAAPSQPRKRSVKLQKARAAPAADRRRKEANPDRVSSSLSGDDLSRRGPHSSTRTGRKHFREALCAVEAGNEPRFTTSAPRSTTSTPNSTYSAPSSITLALDPGSGSIPNGSMAAVTVNTVQTPPIQPTATVLGPNHMNAIANATTAEQLSALITDDQFEQILQAHLRVKPVKTGMIWERNSRE